MPPPKPPTPCRTPGCRLPASSRGVCARCYARCQGRVRRGESTWKDLEVAGTVLPVTLPGHLRQIKGWSSSKAKVVKQPRRRFDREPTEEELDAMIAEQLPTMPGWDPGDD